MNEAPTSLSIDSATITENLPAGSTVGTLLVEDPDEGEAHSFTLADGALHPDNELFDVTGNELRIKKSLDFETKQIYSVQVIATDSGDLSLELALEISVLDDDSEDSDGDGLTQKEEEEYLTSDLNPDMDSDGWKDGLEVTIGSDPLLPREPGTLLQDPNGYVQMKIGEVPLALTVPQGGILEPQEIEDRTGGDLQAYPELKELASKKSTALEFG